MIIRNEGEFLKAKLQLLELEEKERAYREANKIEFWRPLPHQQKVLDLIHAGKKTVLLQGANRVGKSVLGVNIVGSACLGYQPWDGGETCLRQAGKVKCRICVTDWEHSAREVIVPALKEWLPQGSYETRKNNVGVDAFWTFRNGSTIEIMTYIQDTKQHEGWKGHLVWFDEEVPRDKYVANKRGLVDYSGVCVMTFTAVYESWILDDLVLKADDPSIGCVTNIPIRANPHLKEEDIHNYELSLTEEEKIARIEGGWMQLTGLVLKEFDKTVHVIQPFRVPVDLPVVAGIDLHLSKPQAIGFYAVDKQERIFVVDEIWQHLSPEEIADEIVRKKKFNVWRLEFAFIDPLAKGDEKFMKHRFDAEDSFTIIANRIRLHGIRLETGSKDRESAIRNIKAKLMGANKMPSLFFFNTCKRHLFEIQRWTHERFKENDDMMENLGRYTLLGIRYTPLELWSKKLKFAQAGLSV